MAHSSLFFKNSLTGDQKEAPVGFSWTTCFFGPFPALFRTDWKWFAIQSICAIIIPLSGIIFMFIYNKLYIKDLIAGGYKVRSIHSTYNLKQLSFKLGIDIPEYEE